MIHDVGVLLGKKLKAKAVTEKDFKLGNLKIKVGDSVSEEVVETEVVETKEVEAKPKTKKK